jgi:hypothetical protein
VLKARHVIAAGCPPLIGSQWAWDVEQVEKSFDREQEDDEDDEREKRFLRCDP